MAVTLTLSVTQCQYYSKWMQRSVLRAVTRAPNVGFWVIVSALIAPQPMIPSNTQPHSFLSYLVINLINCPGDARKVKV